MGTKVSATSWPVSLEACSHLVRNDPDALQESSNNLRPGRNLVNEFSQQTELVLWARNAALCGRREEGQNHFSNHRRR
jgi:hypothetical protein